MQEEGCFLEVAKLSLKIASVRVNLAKTKKVIWSLLLIFKFHL